MIDALEAPRLPPVVQRDEGTAMRTAVLEGADGAVLGADDDDGHLAHEGRAEVARPLDVGLEADIAPHRPLEDTAQLRAIVGVVLVHPVRNAGEGVSRPGMRRLSGAHSRSPSASHSRLAHCLVDCGRKVSHAVQSRHRQAARRGKRRTRPGRAPVWSPPSITTVPLTMTVEMPAAY